MFELLPLNFINNRSAEEEFNSLPTIGFQYSSLIGAPFILDQATAPAGNIAITPLLFKIFTASFLILTLFLIAFLLLLKSIGRIFGANEGSFCNIPCAITLKLESYREANQESITHQSHHMGG